MIHASVARIQAVGLSGLLLFSSPPAETNSAPARAKVMIKVVEIIKKGEASYKRQ